MIHWEFPWAFFLLLPLVIPLIKKPKKGRFFYSDLKLFSKIPSSFKAKGKFLPFAFKLLGIILIIIAIARPRKMDEQILQKTKGIDILLVLDISLSMLVPDMGERITRLESAKEVMKDFISRRFSDRIGLIVFSGESYTLVPLTLDYDFLLKRLEEVNITDNLKGGTAIGVALANAAARMRHSPLDSRVIVFLTDGENNAGFIDPLTALDFLTKENIRVYTIGVGRFKGRTPIRVPIKDSFGRKRYQLQTIETNINEELMKEMAQKTKGKFFRAKYLLDMKSIFEEIDSLEKQSIPEEKWIEYKELFPYPLLGGLFFYVWGLFLSLTLFFRGV